MNNFFEVKVKYEKIDEQSGRENKVTEKYLIDAVSFGEAEQRIYKEMKQMIIGEFIVTDIKRTNYTEILSEESGDKWFKSKISFASIDVRSGKEKKVSNYILVMANNVDDAYSNINTAMKNMTIDFIIDGIVDSKIIDVFTYCE